MTKAIIISDPEVFDFFTNKYPDWDTQRPVTSIDDFWNGLENGELDNHTEIIIISDQYFDPTGKSNELEQALATLAPVTLVMLITYSPEYTDSIINSAKRLAREVDPSQDLDIYTIDSRRPLDDVDTNIDLYRRKIQAISGGRVTEQVGAEYTDNLGTAPQEEDRNGMILVSTSSKGGSGKSSVALLLAAQISKSSEESARRGLADRKLDICIVDLDIFDGQIGFLIGETEPTALNVRAEQSWDIKTIKKYLVYSERMGVHALLAPKRGRNAIDTTPDFYNVVIGELTKAFDIVILDTSVQYLDRLLKDVALPNAHAILFVTDLGISSVMGMNRWFEETTLPKEMGGYGLDINRIGIIINKSMPSVYMDKQKIIEASSGAPILSAIPMDSQAFLSAANRNRLELLVESHAEIGPAYYKLARKILGTRYPLAEIVKLEEIPPAAKRVRRDQPTGAPAGEPQRGRPVGETMKKKRRLFGRRK